MKSRLSLGARRKLTLWAVVALVAAGTALMSAVATAAQDHPLRAVYVCTFVESDGPWNIWVGTGSGTVVGPSTVDIRVRVSGKKGVGSTTITAANGDLLYYEFAQTWDEATQRFVGPYTITGGTGRFANAAGTGTTIAIPNGDGTVTGPLEGTISF